MTPLYLEQALASDVAPLVRCVAADWQTSPLSQLAAWLSQALTSADPLADVMCLATAGVDGMPNQRILSFRGLCEQGLSFFSNYTGVKAQELAGEPRAALTFYWQTQHRQLRARGVVERLPEAVSDAYFRTRPLGSRRTAILSEQSRELPLGVHGADELPELDRAQAAELAQRARRPATWGGYALRPTELEFWQAGPDRWHERVRWSSGDARTQTTPRTWRSARLYP